MAFCCGIVYILVLGYIDFEIITPLVLPQDPCYYHTHETPVWVEVLYMGIGSNGHPDGSIKHLILIVILSMTLGHFTVKMIRLKKSKNVL